MPRGAAPRSPGMIASGQLALSMELGFDVDAKIVVAHQDDVGMCHGANLAFATLAGGGFITSGSVMVPCPWFPEIAELARNNPLWDLGVHLTLTSEWRHYRWRPLTTEDPADGLCDPNGYMWPTARDVRINAKPAAVERELRAQIELARDAGIDVTHLDCHMGTALAPEFADIYVELGAEYRVPGLFPNSWNEYSSILRLGDGDPAAHARRCDSMRSRFNPIFDKVVETPWAPVQESERAYSSMLDDLSPGLTFLALHCNAPGDIEAIDPRRSHARVYEFQRFQETRFLEQVKESDIKLVGFREMRDIMRSQNGWPPYHSALEDSIELRA